MKLRDEIVREYRRHAYLRNSDKLSPEEQAELTELSSPVHMSELLEDNTFQNEAGRYSTTLRFLSVCLQKHHGRKTIILLDEYDVPLENAYSTGFYPEMAAFIHSLFESALKTNDALEFAVITGCLPISKESIFPGMNSLAISSIRG